MKRTKLPTEIKICSDCWPLQNRSPSIGLAVSRGSQDATADPNDASANGDRTDFDPSLVLILGKSRINSIVVGKIVERSGLKFLCEVPERGLSVLGKCMPAIVVLDGGIDNHDCEPLMAQIEAARRHSGRQIPAVILLSTANFQDVSPVHSAIVDAVVSKPILPELLQPVVDRLVQRIRG